MTNTAPDELFVHKIDPNQREDLRNVYLAIHGSAITTEIPQVAADLKLKPRYVAELVGILETHADRDGNAFVVVNSQPGEHGNEGPHTWYQTSHTVDEHDRDEAEHWFDRHFPVQEVQEREPKASAPRTPQNATNPADLPACRCGCGEILSNRKRNYKPGHDARHAGQVARAIAEHDPDEDTRNAWLNALPTDALRTKASDMADRLLTKAAAKTRSTRKQLEDQGKTTDEIEKVQFASGKVKVGRWEYPAEQNMTSGAVSFTRKGTVEVADAKVAATFKADKA